MAFNPVDVELVKESADIVSTVRRYVELKRSGSSWKGLCPFHREKTPSFHVFPARGTWKCFGCGEGGDVISFLMKHRNLTFMEVVEEIAEENGISLNISKDTGASADRKKGLYRVLEAAQEFYADCFTGPSGSHAREYLHKRQIDESALDLGIGYAPCGNACLQHLTGRGFSVSTIVEAGMVIADNDSQYDRFRNRLTFPIRDRRGRIVSFGARALDDSPAKYINGPETDIYRKGSFLYGYSRAQKPARDTGRVILVEGYFDHARLISAGIEETVATSGTALTEKQARNLMGMSDCLYICYDGDSAGTKAAVRAAEIILSQGGYPEIVKLPPGNDPDDVVLNTGADSFLQMVEEALDPVSFCISLLPDQPARGQSKTRIARRLLQIAGAASDPLAQEDLKEKIEKYTGYSRTALSRALEESRPNTGHVHRGSDRRKELSVGDRAVLKASTAGGVLDREFIEFLKPDDMTSETGRKILLELISQVEAGYSTVVFGEFTEGTAGIAADIAGILDSVTTEDMRQLKKAIERTRREKPRRRKLLARLNGAGADERALILEDLSDSGGLHDR